MPRSRRSKRRSADDCRQSSWVSKASEGSPRAVEGDGRSHFTSHLRNLVPDGPLSASRARRSARRWRVLFAGQPHVRGYVLDDQGRLRKHVCIFADGERLAHDSGARRADRPAIPSSTSCRRCRAAECSEQECVMSDRLLVATRKGLFTLERKRDGWTANLDRLRRNSRDQCVARQRDGVMFAALKHGHFGPKLHRSDDDGRTWRELAAPAFPADAPGAPSLFQIWTLEAAAPHHPDRLWIGAIPAGLFRSDDRGESWQLMHVAVGCAGTRALVRRRL